LTPAAIACTVPGMARSFTEHVAHLESLRDLAIGERVRVTISGRTGTVASEHRRHSGFKVRWDEPMFGVEEAYVSAANLERLALDTGRDRRSSVSMNTDRNTTTEEASMTGKTKQDTYQRVTDRIIEALENGTVPWRKPWNTTRRPDGNMPRNLNSGRPYRGINIFLTSMTAMAEGYSESRWATFNGIKKAGGSVRKGEKGTLVILWKPIEKRDKATNEVTDKFLMLKGYTVFNVEQADFPNGVPGAIVEDTDEEIEEFDIDAATEAIVTRYIEDGGPKLAHGGDAASYSQVFDMVRMPERTDFTTRDSYYTTLLHELVHSTGHESRLDRLDSSSFGSEPYAKEELIAELGAAMLSAVTGIDNTQDASASYIASWLRELRDDKQLVVKAAAAAQRAADLILGTKFEDKNTDTEEAAATAAA
jgi:antirestriction protein ArdC